MSASMAGVLAEHPTRTSYQPSVFRTVSICEACGVVGQDHQEAVLAAAGYGKLEDAWGEGHYSGEWNYQHRRMIEAHPHEARKNPYRQDADK